MDRTADTAWCPLELLLTVTNSILSTAFQEIFIRTTERERSEGGQHHFAVSRPFFKSSPNRIASAISCIEILR